MSIDKFRPEFVASRYLRSVLSRMAFLFLGFLLLASETSGTVCVTFARTPIVCSNEQRVADQQADEVSFAMQLENLPLNRALKRLDALALTAKEEGKTAAPYHQLRGKVFAAHGLLAHALCELQTAALQGLAAAGDEASALLPEIESAELRNFTEVDELRKAFVVARNSTTSMVLFARLLDEWRFEHVHHSTAIEGNPLPYTEVRALLETQVTQSGRHVQSLFEVFGTDEALSFVVNASGFSSLDSLASAPPVSEQLLLDIHKRVLLGSPADAGVWRTVPVRVADHVAPPPAELPRLMASLLAHWNSDAFAALHPVEQAALAHFEFAWVHPFVDGNGRTARLLSSYLLMRAGLPPLNLLITQQSDYYAALKRSHPRNGGCTRQLVQLFWQRILALAKELRDGLPRPADAPLLSEAEIRPDGPV